MKKPLIFIVVVTLAAVALSSCKLKKIEIAPEIAASDEALFKAGQEAVKHDSERARLYFRQVIESFPKSFYAQRAKLAIADSYYAKGDEGSMILAASEYREFIQLYPFSPSAPYAQFQIAMSNYAKVLAPGRDQSKTQQALLEFRKVLANFPTSEEAGKAPKYIGDCEDRLAAHTLGIGQLYYRQGAYKAASGRLTDILTNYPTFARMDEVYFFLGDAHFKGGKSPESVPFFTKLVTDYPKSKFAVTAKQRLDAISKGKVPTYIPRVKTAKKKTLTETAK